MRRWTCILSILAAGLLLGRQPAAAATRLDAETMKAALRTVRIEEDGFLDYVAALVEAGALPRDMVDGTLQWARQKPRHKFQYFRQALIVRAERAGIRL